MCQKIILYEDDSVIVAMKPANLAVQTKRIEEEDLCSLLRKHLAQENKKKQPPYLAPINRLDQPVRGLVLFAKTRAAAANLSGQCVLLGRNNLCSVAPPRAVREQSFLRICNSQGLGREFAIPT